MKVESILREVSKVIIDLLLMRPNTIRRMNGKLIKKR